MYIMYVRRPVSYMFVFEHLMSSTLRERKDAQRKYQTAGT